MNEAARQKLANIEQRRISQLQKLWRAEHMSAPLDESTQQRAASIFAADKEREETFKDNLRHEQAVSLADELHQYQSRKPNNEHADQQRRNGPGRSNRHFS